MTRRSSKVEPKTLTFTSEFVEIVNDRLDALRKSGRLISFSGFLEACTREALELDDDKIGDLLRNRGARGRRK